MNFFRFSTGNSNHALKSIIDINTINYKKIIGPPNEGRLSANDKDTVGEITFSTNSNLISVAEDSGDIILIQALDFEDGFQLFSLS